MGKMVSHTLTSVLAVALLLVPLCSGQETAATKKLKARNAEFREEVIQVTDGVYTAVGYSESNVSMIVGSDGVIIIDTGMTLESAKRILAQFRKITNKPLKAIIYTHGHADHTGGASVFVGDSNPEIWARSDFGSEERALGTSGLTISRMRGARQAGFLLPPEKRINNGVAPARWPKQAGEAFAARMGGAVPPNMTFDSERKRLEIASVRIELVAAPGETDDHLYAWLPEKEVLFSGDNFYKSFPNLYTIRGTPYRDIREWASSVDKMLKERPEYLVPGHTRPILGRQAAAQALTDYRDAIRFVFDKTIEGMNRGLTPDELVQYVQLPQHLAEKDYLLPYYGHPAWSVRSIFTGYVGWFDGNPTNLLPLSPREEAARIAELAGGREALREKAGTALAEGDHQWAAQLCDYLLALDSEEDEAKRIKADALTALGENLLTATGRNYYLTAAQELQKEIEGR